MISGIGTDIVDIARIRKVLVRQGRAFAKRILHEHEYAVFQQRFNPCDVPTQQMVAWLAKRFATKEAVSKALGTGIGEHVRLQDIETIHDALGKPDVCLHGITATTAQRQGVQSVQLSLADEQAYAVAFVVMIGGDDVNKGKKHDEHLPHD